MLFVDASHFVFGHDQLTSVYSRQRMYKRNYQGRKRYSVFSAINFADCDITTITSTETINALDTLELLLILHDKYKNKKIHIVLDNARYQHAKIVNKLAKYLNIDLVFLPPYSPNLNLIERLWKFVKKQLKKKFISNFEEFITTINTIMDNCSNIYHSNVRQLISNKIQLFNQEQIIPDVL